MAEYYVVRDKNTGLYFRGKGVNRWGKYYNQASIYRIRANAENTIKEVSWRGEQAEIVPIQIIETTADVVPKSEVEALEKEVKRLKHILDCYALQYGTVKDQQAVIDKANQAFASEIFAEIENEINNELQNNYKVLPQFEFSNELWNKISGRIEALKEICDFIAELKKKYTEETK